MKTGTKLVRWTTDNWDSNFREMRYHLLSHHPASHFWGWLWSSLCPMCMHHSCCNLGLQVALGALILKCKIFKTNIQTYAVFNPVSLLLSILQCVLPLVEVPHWSLSYTCIELSYTRHLRVVYLGFPQRHVWELLPNENWFSAYHHYCAFHFCNKQLWKSTHEDLFGLMARMGSLHGWCSDTVSLWWFTVVGVQGYTSLLNLRRRSKQERQKTLRSDCTCAGQWSFSDLMISQQVSPLVSLFQYWWLNPEPSNSATSPTLSIDYWDRVLLSHEVAQAGFNAGFFLFQLFRVLGSSLGA